MRRFSAARWTSGISAGGSRRRISSAPPKSSAPTAPTARRGFIGLPNVRERLLAIESHFALGERALEGAGEGSALVVGYTPGEPLRHVRTVGQQIGLRDQTTLPRKTSSSAENRNSTGVPLFNATSLALFASVMYDSPMMTENTDAGTAPDAPALVLLGATGDMATSKLLPALGRLAQRGALPDDLELICVDTDSEKDIGKTVRKAMTGDPHTSPFSHGEKLTPFSGDLRDSATYAAYDNYRNPIRCLKRLVGNRRAYYYCAVSPDLYGSICAHLLRNGMMQSENARIILEKPFGVNAQDTADILETIRDSLGTRVMLVDHYLYKPTVARVPEIRSALRSFWNRSHIDHVQITAAELESIGKRSTFYEKVGALLDMVQNHLLQLLCVVAADPDVPSLNGKAHQRAALKVLRSIENARYNFVSAVSSDKWIVRGQYTANDTGTPAYREEQDVNSKSETETFVALQILLDSERWRDVPFFLRTGKRMSRKKTTILVQFKTDEGEMCESVVFHIEPDRLPRIEALPSPDGRFRLLNQEFRDAIGATRNDGDEYETIISECFSGTLSRGVSTEWISQSWDLVEKVQEIWANPRLAASLHTYPAGTDGPNAANDLIRQPRLATSLHTYPAGTDGPNAANDSIRQTGREWLPFD